MKTLIYTNTGLTSWQIGINTEVIEKLNDGSRDLMVVHCNNILSNCFFNQTHNPIGCALCQSRQNHLLSIAGIKKTQIVVLQNVLKDKKIELPFFNHLDELIDYNFASHNIGRGVASSIISYTRNFSIDSHHFKELIKIEMKKSINVLMYFQQVIEEFGPKEIYLFNGRFSEVWPVTLLAKENGIDFYCIEAGSPNKYELFKNALPHSISNRHRMIMDRWNTAAPADRDKKAKLWFERRRNRSNTEEKQYTNLQSTGKLPESFDQSKTNIVIFNSSEDEFKALKESISDLYSSQNEAIETIVAHFRKDPQIQFHLRVHPNLSSVKNQQLEEIQEMSFPNLNIIPPKDVVDTYALMNVADKVISFGSSTGIEATYWGAPSILLGTAFFQYLDVVYHPDSYEELYSMIKHPALSPKTKENTYPYGYYMSTYGTTPESFVGKGLKQSFYKGRKIRIFYPGFFKYLFKYLSSVLLWIRIQRALHKKIRLNTLKRFK